MSIDGLVSGLDTTSIISQLMQVERQPQVIMQSRQDAMKGQLDAYGSVGSKLDAVASAATALQRSGGWALRTATSTVPSVATASVSDGAAMGSLSFTVDQLAVAHGLATATDVAATTDVIASGGSVTLTTGGTPTAIPVGGGTLAEVVDAINASGLGVRAATVNTGAGYRLQLTSTGTGAASAFTLTGLDPGVGGTVVTSTGADARISMGTGPGAYAVTSSSNSFADLMPGVTVTVTATSATPVVVTVGADASALANKVAALADAVNGALSEIATRTAYDPKTNRAASLTGDSTVTRLKQDLVRAVLDPVGTGTSSGATVGLSVDRYGKVTFDKGKFAAAFAADPAGIQALFAQGGTASAGVTFVGAGDRTRGGTYDVAVTTAPAPGVDVVGTIDGVAAVGQGDLLTLPSDASGAAAGLVVRIAGLGAGGTGTVTYTPGIAQRLASVVVNATDSSTGYLTSTKTAKQSSVDDLQRSIDSFEQRMTLRQAALKKQYAALEVALGNLRNQSNWLAGQLGSLSANSGSGS